MPELWSPEPPPAPTPLRYEKLVIADRFDVLMLDMPASGACLRVKPIDKYEAVDIVQANPDATVIASDERARRELENELGVPRQRIDVLGVGGTLLVMRTVTWRDRRYYLVRYEADG